MTIQEVRDRLALIEASSGDNEAAHGYQDTLYANVLAAIAEGTAENPAEMARLAITAAEIPFDRWYA